MNAHAHLCQCGCGSPVTIHYGKPRRFITGHGSKRGTESPRWKGGRKVSKLGYVLVYTPEHPRAAGGYVREHVLIVDRALGKPLDVKHPVHHVDGNGENNANTNLVVCEDQAYHMLLEQRTRALLACGDANALKCRFCGDYDVRANLVIRHRPDRRNGIHGEHAECARAYARKRHARITGISTLFTIRPDTPEAVAP